MIYPKVYLDEMDNGDLFIIKGGLIKLCEVVGYMDYKTIGVFQDLEELEDYLEDVYPEGVSVFEKEYEY